MLTIWAIAFVLGLIALCVSLWVTFWVVLYVVVFFRVAHQDLSYRRAESIILASMLASNGRLRFEKPSGKKKRLMRSGALKGWPLSTKENDKPVPTALLLHGLLLLAYSEKLSFSYSPLRSYLWCHNHRYDFYMTDKLHIKFPKKKSRVRNIFVAHAACLRLPTNGKTVLH